MKNMKISKKLTVGFLVITVFSFVLACVGIYSTMSINDNYVYLIGKPSARETYLLEMRTDFMGMRYRAANFVMNSGDSEIINGTLIPQYKAAYTDFQDKLAAYTQNNNSDTRRDAAVIKNNSDKASQLDSLMKQYDQAAGNVLSFALSGDAQSADAILKEIIPLSNQINALMDELITPAVTFVDETSVSMGQYANIMTTVQICVAIVCLILALVLAFRISSMISKPVIFIRDILHMIGIQGVANFTHEENRIAEGYAAAKDEIGESVNMLLATGRRLESVGNSLKTVASGDLTVELPLLSNRDTIGSALKEMLDNLNTMFGEINIASKQVSSGAEQVSQGAQGLAAGSSEQAASIEELSVSLSELQEKTDHNAKNSADAQEANNRTADKLEDSIHSMSQMLDAMKSIDESSSNITKVIKVIDDIAFQTNILALNAAVEAARAGQHGKGFAVVADEVRNLASKSADAAKETSALIEGSTARVKEGNEIVARTNADLEAAAENARESTNLIELVAKASTDQAKSIIEINQGMNQISAVVQANSATAEQSAAASEEMSAQAVVMNEIVAKFELRQTENRGVSYSGMNDSNLTRTVSSSSSTGFALSGSKY